jgi:hypothetical protein
MVSLFHPKRELVDSMVRTKSTTFFKNPWWEWNGNINSQHPDPPSDYHTSSASQDLITSFGHNVSNIGKHDIGGPFHCLRKEHEFALHGPVRNRTTADPTNSNAFNYYGYYYAFGAAKSSDFPTVPLPSDSTLDVHATRAISQVIPTNPLSGLAVTLGEFRTEGLAQIPAAEILRQRALRARNAGQEYLNVEFGWRPLVNDVLSLANSIINSDELTRQYVNESGRVLHRSYTYPWDTSTSTSTLTGQRAIPIIKQAYSTATGTQTVVTTTLTKRWFEGTFTYHLAPQGSLARKEQIAAKLYGTRITPEVLWNLTPWTWAADWVFNLGDVIHNVSAFAADGLVMPWAYMMEQTSISKEYTFSGSRLTINNQDFTSRQKLTTTRKYRRKATPFGFGLNPSTFSGRQWSILVALGLARAPGQMST